MQHYSVGFVFDRQMDEVLLIHKLKPEWQAGKLNGPGGKVEENEDYVTAMAREFEEETGMVVPEHMWREYCTTRARDGIVHFFTTDVSFNSRVILQSPEAEKIAWWRYDPLPSTVIDNLRWLIPMALGTPVRAEVNECSACPDRYSG